MSAPSDPSDSSDQLRSKPTTVSDRVPPAIAAEPIPEWQVLCPACGGASTADSRGLWCDVEARRIESHRRGVLPLLSEKRRLELDNFLKTYRTVRKAEGWGGSRDYYTELPHRDRSRLHRHIWKLRSRSFAIAERIVKEWSHGRPLKLLELGAGNGWFSYRMAQAGHLVLATDISIDEEDGLGALDRYQEAALNTLSRAQADMEQLPLASEQFDLVVANGSLHYAEALDRVLQQAHRLLQPGGLFLILDSPTYSAEQAGQDMLTKQRQEYRQRFGVDIEQRHIGYFVWSSFIERLRSVGFEVRSELPFEGIRRMACRLYCRLRSLNPPARFPVFIAERK